MPYSSDNVEDKSSARVPYTKLLDKNGQQITMPDALFLTDKAKSILRRGRNRQGFAYFIKLDTGEVEVLAANNPEKEINIGFVNHPNEVATPFSMAELNADETQILKTHYEQSIKLEKIRIEMEKIFLSDKEKYQILNESVTNLEKEIDKISQPYCQIIQKLKAPTVNKLALAQEVKLDIPIDRYGIPYGPDEFATTRQPKTDQTGGAGNGDLHINGARILKLGNANLLSGGFWIEWLGEDFDLSLVEMSDAGVFKNSEKTHLFLYKEHGQFFYFIDNKKIALEDEKNQLPPAVKLKLNAASFSHDPIKCTDFEIIDNVQTITAKREHTVPLKFMYFDFRTRSTMNAQIVKLNQLHRFIFDMRVKEEDRGHTLVYLREIPRVYLEPIIKLFLNTSAQFFSAPNEKVREEFLSKVNDALSLERLSKTSAIPAPTRWHLEIERCWEGKDIFNRILQVIADTQSDTKRELSYVEVGKWVAAYFDKDFPENLPCLEEMFDYVNQSPSISLSKLIEQVFDEYFIDLTHNGPAADKARTLLENFPNQEWLQRSITRGLNEVVECLFQSCFDYLTKREIRENLKEPIVVDALQKHFFSIVYHLNQKKKYSDIPWLLTLLEKKSLLPAPLDNIISRLFLTVLNNNCFEEDKELLKILFLSNCSVSIKEKMLVTLLNEGKLEFLEKISECPIMPQLYSTINSTLTGIGSLCLCLKQQRSLTEDQFQQALNKIENVNAENLIVFLKLYQEMLRTKRIEPQLFQPVEPNRMLFINKMIEFLRKKECVEIVPQELDMLKNGAHPDNKFLKQIISKFLSLKELSKVKDFFALPQKEGLLTYTA